MKKHIAVLFGGMSTEHAVSCVSAACVIDNMDKDKYQISKIGITKDGVWFLFDGSTDDMRSLKWIEKTENLHAAIISPCSVHHGFMVLDKLNKKYEIVRVDAVFPVLHGKNGEDGTMQGLLRIAGIPFVGCDTYSSAICMDKVSTKILCERENIPTVPFVCVRKTVDFDMNAAVCEVEESFPYPVFVKPANAGSSVGITKATDRASLINGIVTAFLNDRKILIEKAVKGKEIEVAVFGNEKPVASVTGEIVPNSEFYDYNTKYHADTAEYFIPARINLEINEKISKVALKIFKTLDCRGFARVDFFVCEDGTYYLNEINTIPGFTPISMYPRLMKEAGFAYSALIEQLIELAIEQEKVK
ncbi:MAG: D-alanine--D-alanine ligase A [Clostridiales bacterium GWF2_36_10]|nr:MAG: D-alanine--D-alanine ligase A [Clostridiales bacterium GWF2_36_10]